MSGYTPIGNYGMIGDMRTVALVNMAGSLDWLCYPRFDSPSVFAAILDADKGGRFVIGPADNETDINPKQLYWPDTNILITRFLNAEGVGELIDYMPVDEAQAEDSPVIIRTVRAVRGHMDFKMRCDPAFDYGRTRHETILEKNGAKFVTGELSLGLSSTLELKQTERGVLAEFSLEEGEETTFILQNTDPECDCVKTYSPKEAEKSFRQTVGYWRNWIGKCSYTGRWREFVHRSAFVLKLLTYQPTGAIIAAPTCSLPETIGGERNWDYRYTWIRDAAFTIYALIRIGLYDEARHFMQWLAARCTHPDGEGKNPLQLMYTVDGETIPEETLLDHLEGYRESSPVRIGNAASTQTQLDIYGELIDSVYLYNKHAAPISYELWEKIRQLADFVCKHWQETDAGIWEIRAASRHHVHSKFMCWVALDRALKIADLRGFPADRPHWEKNRDLIYEDVIANGWSEKIKAFTQSYDNDALDASILLMLMTFFMSPDDSKMIATVEAILKPPDEGGLVTNRMAYRYNLDETHDGLKGEEGTFNICTFWLVDALVKLSRHNPQYLEEARLMFENMMSFSNHLGLFSEEIGLSGEALGNYPQAFTHLALISAASNLDAALDKTSG